MRICHTCQKELESASLAAGRCAHCGTAVRPLAKRTIEDKQSLHQLQPGAGESDSNESLDIDVLETLHPGATIQFSPEDTAQTVPPAEPIPHDTKSDPGRKSPTVGDQAEMTIEFLPPPAGDASRDSASTIDSHDRPLGHATHTIEGDRTMDFDNLSDEEAKLLESQWSGTFERGSKQGHTIRQKETVSGFRSSLPVKSRYIREKRKNGGPKPVTPAEVPDYELLEIIGEGGMGVVYAAHQSSIARTVAVKMLKPSPKIREEQRDKFISEAVVTGELDHPNIVPIYDLGANDAGALFYSMKRVKGTPWDKVLANKPLDENLSILLRVADAVAFAHAHGVVHRDLKPENVMLGDYGEVLVMDWGLARITTMFANAEAIFQADSLGGTPAYMAPEMARGPVENINFSSDIYLLGAILYEIIGGKPPHSGRDVMQCLMNAAQNQIDGIRYDGELKIIALRAMATRQEDRYPSVKEFQEAIRVYQSHSESLVLTAHANLNLQKARENGDYQLFARALYGFQEALNLWDANHRARALLADTQRDYAQDAMAKGDLDLAASLLDAKNPDQVDLIQKIDVARAERDARQRRLRRAKQAVAALVAAVVTIITVSLFIVNQQRNLAVQAQKEEEVQRQEAEHQKDIADQQRQEAVEQRLIADRQRERAEEQEQIARREEARALEQEAIARREEERATLAKEAEEYESYVAQIGLAAAKINDNAFDFAKELLDGCKPELRNWEWGRLAHMCNLDAGSYQAAGPVDSVAYSPDGRQIASGDWGGMVSVRNALTGQEIFSVKHGQYAHAVAYSPDSRRLATGSSDHKIRILDAGTGELLDTLEGHTDGVLGVQYSPDGKQLLSCSYDNTAKLWDLATHRVLQTFQDHSWWVWRAKFSPNGNRIVTASQDGKAIVWEKQAVDSQPSAIGQSSRADGRPPTDDGALYTKLTEFTGHSGAVYAANFSPDGKLVATGGYDKMVMVWNPDEVEPLDLGRRLEGLPDPKPNYLQLTGHVDAVRSVAFSPNGELVASGSDDNSIRLWNLATGKEDKVLRRHGSGVRSCTFSPDGEFVLSGSQDEYVRLWNLAGYQEVRVLHSTVFEGHADAVLSAQFSPDGREIVTASRDRTACLWDAASGKRLREFEEGHDFLATNAAFFPDGRRLATSAGDNTVRIWDIALGTQITVLEQTGRLGALAVSPNGDWLATGSPGNGAQIWDAHSGVAIATLSGHEAAVSAIAFSPQGNVLATGDDRGRIRLWEPQDAPGQWKLLHELRGHSRSITAMRFTPDGARLVTSSGDRTCGQWDVATGQEKRDVVLKHPNWVSSLDLSADGTLAITACEDGAVRLWRLADAEVAQTLRVPDRKFSAVSIAPDGKSALVTSSLDRQVQIWNLSDEPNSAGPDSAATLVDFAKLGGMVWTAMFTHDAEQFLTIGGDEAELWNLESRRRVMRFSPHGAVASADLSPDGRLLVTGSWDHSAKIWDAATGRAIRKLDGGHTGFINTAEFSPDGREILTASDDGTARLWEVASGKMAGLLRGHASRLLAATFSSDGTRVLTVSADKTARIWDRATGAQRVTLTGHEWAVLCGQFSPDGTRVITGSQDNTARIWEAATGRELLPLGGHTAAVTSVAFSPDGSRVLTGSQDNTVKLWDAHTGKEILSLTGHQEEVTSVAFSPDGKLALSSSRDGTAIVWLAVDWHDDAALRTAKSR